MAGCGSRRPSERTKACQQALAGRIAAAALMIAFTSLLLTLTAGYVLTSVGIAQTAPQPNPSRWNLLLEGGKGESLRDPLCHPLQYFSGPPSLFDFDRDLSGMDPADMRIKTIVKSIGQIKGRKIVLVIQSISDDESLSPIVMKRLLVQHQGKEFCAIYQQEYSASLVVVRLAKIETVQGEPVLVTRDQNGQRDLNQEYWTFDEQGPIRLDLRVINEALAAILPKGYETRGDYGLNLQALCYQNPVWKRQECDACASGGTVAMKLGLQDHHLVIVRKQYDPHGRAGAEPDLAACTP